MLLCARVIQRGNSGSLEIFLPWYFVTKRPCLAVPLPGGANFTLFDHCLMSEEVSYGCGAFGTIIEATSLGVKDLPWRLSSLACPTLSRSNGPRGAGVALRRFWGKSAAVPEEGGNGRCEGETGVTWVALASSVTENKSAVLHFFFFSFWEVSAETARCPRANPCFQRRFW